MRLSPSSISQELLSNQVKCIAFVLIAPVFILAYHYQCVLEIQKIYWGYSTPCLGCGHASVGTGRPRGVQGEAFGIGHLLIYVIICRPKPPCLFSTYHWVEIHEIYL